LLLQGQDDADNPDMSGGSDGAASNGEIDGEIEGLSDVSEVALEEEVRYGHVFDFVI
jgi:hypothetical protein